MLFLHVFCIEKTGKGEEEQGEKEEDHFLQIRVWNNRNSFQRASPNRATARGSIVVLAQECVCVLTCFVVEGVVLCCSCMMFLGPLPGTF